MNADTITHTTLKELVEAGAIRRACAVAFGDRWGLVFSYGGVEKTLRSKNSHNVRNWANLNSVANYLAELGIRKFETDATNYDPNQKTLIRPDKSAALKRAHQAAEYDQWFREQVQAAIDDPRPSVPHDEAVRKMEAELTRRIGPRLAP